MLSRSANSATSYCTACTHPANDAPEPRHSVPSFRAVMASVDAYIVHAAPHGSNAAAAFPVALGAVKALQRLRQTVHYVPEADRERQRWLPRSPRVQLYASVGASTAP